MNRIFFLLVIVSVAAVFGCKKQPETTSIDHRLLIVTDPYLPLMQQEVEQYTSLYPKVRIELRGASTREAVVLLLNDSVYTIMIDRQLNDEEKQIAQQASLHLVESKLAEDGIVIIVNDQNLIQSIAEEAVRSIALRKATDWSQITNSQRSGPIDVVLTGRNSGMYELLQKKIFNQSKPLEPNTVLASQHEVIQYVSTHPQSVGFVAASLLTGENVNVRKLPILTKSPEGVEKEYLPGQQEIHEALYPYHYLLYLYNTETKAAVGVGFSALVLSNIGQKIFQRSGLVPVSIPYRTIQLQAE